jgi:hypothetical protein
MKPAAVSKRLGCSVPRARELMMAGAVPAMWLGKRIYSPTAAFDRWYAERVEKSLAVARANVRELAYAS